MWIIFLILIIIFAALFALAISTDINYKSVDMDDVDSKSE